MLLGTIHILTPTPQVLPLIDGIAFQPHPTTIAILRRRQREKKRYEKKFANGGLHSESIGVSPAVFEYPRKSQFVGLENSAIRSQERRSGLGLGLAKMYI